MSLDCSGSRCNLGVVVPPAGVEEAELVILGGSPGREDSIKMKPFMGDAGRLFKRLCDKAGLDLFSCYVTNSCKAYLEDAPTPKKADLSFCRENCLKAEIESHPRRLILALGNSAGYSCGVLSGVSGVTEARGKLAKSIFLNPDGSQIPAIVTIDPAAVLRSGGVDQERLLEKDLRFVLSYLETGKTEQTLPEVELLPDTEESVDRVFEDAEDSGWLAVDLETDGFDPYAPDAQIVGIALCGSSDRALFSRESKAHTIRKLSLVDSEIRVVGHNSKFDGKWLTTHCGLPNNLFTWDTFLAHQLVAEEIKTKAEFSSARSGLKYLAEARLGWPQYGNEIKDLLDGRVNGKKSSKAKKWKMSEIDPQRVEKYACLDALATFLLAGQLKTEIDELKLEEFMQKVAMPISSELAIMEARRLYIDSGLLMKFAGPLQAELSQLSRSIQELSGNRTFNLASAPQVRTLLYGEEIKCTVCDGRGRLKSGKCSECNGAGWVSVEYNRGLKVPIIARTKETNLASTSSAVLNEILGHSRTSEKAKTAIGLILRHRELSKINSNFVHKVISMSRRDEIGDYICPSFRMWVASGRLASSNPNIQQIPKKLRGTYYAGTGRVFIDADAKQAEVRVWAMYSKDPNLIKVFSTRRCPSCGVLYEGIRVCPTCNVDNVQKGDEDPYTIAARVAFPNEEITKDLRNKVKAVFLGAMYGLGPTRLARNLQISFEDAIQLLGFMRKSYPRAFAWIDWMHRKIQEPPYEFRSIHGRIHRFRAFMESKDERIISDGLRRAVNYPIQGPSSDIILLNGVVTARKRLEAEGIDCFPQIFVHDAVTYNCSLSDVSRAVPIIKECLTRSPYKEVMMDVDYSVGLRWGNVSDVGDYFGVHEDNFLNFLFDTEESSDGGDWYVEEN